MLWTITIILFILWVVGLVSSYVGRLDPHPPGTSDHRPHLQPTLRQTSTLAATITAALPKRTTIEGVLFHEQANR